MFTNKNEQLSELKKAYDDFARIVSHLSQVEFLTSLGDWTPRDILAHFIGWNRITLVGCAEIQEGITPFYFYDGLNDYRVINGGFFKRFPQISSKDLIDEMEATMKVLESFLQNVDQKEWEIDTGVIHYRGGFASVARCVDSLIRDYRKHGEEITASLIIP